eukprot:362837-Chlamydomonas_euryale.AAC.5
MAKGVFRRQSWQSHTEGTRQGWRGISHAKGKVICGRGLGAVWAGEKSLLSLGAVWAGEQRLSSLGAVWAGEQSTSSLGAVWAGEQSTSSLGAVCAGEKSTSSLGAGGHDPYSGLSNPEHTQA